MYSTTYAATIILLVTSIANIFGFEVVAEDLQTTLKTLIVIGSAIWILVERFNKGGITALGIRK